MPIVECPSRSLPICSYMPAMIQSVVLGPGISMNTDRSWSNFNKVITPLPPEQLRGAWNCYRKRFATEFLQADTGLGATIYIDPG